METTLWTVRELLGRASSRLRGCPAPRDPRASQLPTLRVLRFYMAVGLVDRPAALRGRAGLYGQRHLHQLLAIKQLQAEGLNLRQIGVQLRALADSELAMLAAPRALRPKPAAPATARAVELELATGVRLCYRGSAPVPHRDAKRLRRAARGVLRILRQLESRPTRSEPKSR